MSDILHIRNARIIDPANDRDETGDLYAVDGRIVPGLSTEQIEEAHTIESEGLVACPGLVDIQVHLREPGQRQKESIKTGSWAAAAGGVTTMVCMGNTSPPCDTPGTLQQLRNIIDRDSVVNIYPVGAATLGLRGEALSPTGSLKKAGAVALSDDGHCIQDNELMRRAVEYADMHGLILLDHCQDYTLTREAVMNEGAMSLKLGLKGWPNAAEDLIVARDIILAETTGAHIHLQHISSAGAIDFIRRAKSRGVRITAEAMPHHLALTDECLRHYNTNFKMNPPLRTETDRRALIDGLCDGTIDCIATDHAPHTPTEKDCEFDKAPFGIIGLETSLAVCLSCLYHENHGELTELIDWMTRRPANILHLGAGTLTEGNAADICLFDPDVEWEVEEDKFFSRSRNSPWIGDTLKGKVRKTFVNGKLVYDGEYVLSPQDSGTILARPGES